MSNRRYLIKMMGISLAAIMLSGSVSGCNLMNTGKEDSSQQSGGVVESGESQYTTADANTFEIDKLDGETASASGDAEDTGNNIASGDGDNTDSNIASGNGDNADSSIVSGNTDNADDGATSGNNKNTGNTAASGDDEKTGERKAACENKNIEKSSESDSTDSSDLVDTYTYYEKFYAPVLQEIYDYIINGSEGDKTTKYVPIGLMEKRAHEDAAKVLANVGYRIGDVSGDGIPELLIVDNEESEYDDGANNSSIFGIFTDKKGELFMTIDASARSAHYWFGDNTFYYLGSGGAANTMVGTYKLTKDGTSSDWDNFYFQMM